MTIACEMPEGNMGVALRLSQFLDCQARALGENGFQALAGGPLVAGLLSGLVTIFVALIGYRLLLGTTPSLSEGVTRTVRLGFVIALATGWPAFQTLVYRVAIDGPADLSAIIMPAAGLPQDDLATRVQQAYDTMRLGTNGTPVDTTMTAGAGAIAGEQGTAATTALPQRNPFGQAPLPQTASWFAISTVGIISGLKVATGFLLAIAPLPIMALLFDATLGFFSGWLRALAGSVFASLAATIVASLDLLLVESELGHVQSAELGSGIVDAQGLTTIVLAGAVSMLIVSILAGRTTGAIRIAAPPPAGEIVRHTKVADSARASSEAQASTTRVGTAAIVNQGLSDERTRSVADALAATTRREQFNVMEGSRTDVSRSATNVSMRESVPEGQVTRIGDAGRRRQARQTRSAMRRDKTA